MLTSLGSTANSDVTYMMMDFLSGNCTATSGEGGKTVGRRWMWGRKIRDKNEKQGERVRGCRSENCIREKQHGRWSEIAANGDRRRLDGKEGERGEKRAG